MIIDDPLLGKIDVPNTPEKVNLKDLWVETQTLKIAMIGIRTRIKLHEWAIVAIIGGLVTLAVSI